jgi:hypothetical protein
MTTREILKVLESSPLGLLIFLCAVPLFVLCLRLVHGSGKGAERPWCYAYSVLVYATSIPGTMAAVITGYTLLFTQENLLDQSVLIYLMPIVMMFVTLMLMSKFVTLQDVPGFDRITGLIALLGITGLAVLLLSRLRFFVGFFGSFTMMIAVGCFLFMMLKWGAGRLFRGPGETKEEPPTFGA